MLLEALFCCLHIWRSNHILWSLLTGFRRKKLSPFSLARDSGSILDFFYGCACSSPLAPSWERRFRICLFSILQSWAGCWETRIYFSYGSTQKCPRFCASSQSNRIGNDADIPVLSVGDPMHCLWRLVPPPAGEYGALTKRGSTEYWGYTSASWRGVQMRWPLEFMGCWDPCTSYCEPLSFFFAPSCPQTIQSCQCPQYSRSSEKDLALLIRNPLVWGSCRSLHSPFVHGENCELRVSFGTELCHLWRGTM